MGINWLQRVESLSLEQAQFSRGETRMALVAHVDFDDILDGSAVKEILGYSTSGNAPLIRRFPPMRCPYNSNLYATKIQQAQFINPGGNDELLASDQPYAVYDTARLVVLFESLDYEILTDDEMNTKGYTDEFNRWCVRRFHNTVEQISRPARSFAFANGPGPVVNVPFPQGLIARTAKRMLTIDWFNVPALCALDPSTEPWSFEDRSLAQSIGCVNDDDWHGYRRGECLLMPSDVIPRVEPVPPELLGLAPGSVPRSFDYRYVIAIYQPQYDPTVLGAGGYHTFGHQTAPSASLGADGTLFHYQVARTSGGTASGNVNTPSAWLYPEVDFDQLFQARA